MQIYNISVPYSNNMLKVRMVGGGRLLDVGGGANPRRANALADLFTEVVIADCFSPRFPLAKNVRFLECRIEDLDPASGMFDHILMSNVLEHIVVPGEALRSAARVLKPRGMIHILSPNCDSLNRRIGFQMGILKSIREITPREKKIGHLHALSVGDVKTMISDAGLDLLECTGVFLKPVPTPEMIKWPQSRIKAFFDIAGEIPPELCHEVYFRAKGDGNGKWRQE
jgi:2-polyprenyl-3-methyl-5-hydroxy-6-metoxy-1,4-benzoquinol methylase